MEWTNLLTENGTYGTYNPSEGEYSEQWLFFKSIAEGKDGDDGNLYKYFLSASPSDNVPVNGGNAFTFEYSFRLPVDVDEICHIYPFVDNRVVSVKQTNFDWDNGGEIKLYSVSTFAKNLAVSGDNKSRVYIMLRIQKRLLWIYNFKLINLQKFLTTMLYFTLLTNTERHCLFLCSYRRCSNIKAML